MLEVTILLSLMAAVWTAVYLLRGSLIVGCLLVLLTGATFGFAFMHFDVAGLPLSIDRVALAVVILAYIVQRGLGLTEPKPMSWPDWCMFGLLGLITLSTFATSWENPADQGVAEWRLVAGYLMPVLLYWIALQSKLERGPLKFFLGGLACFGVYLGITAVFEITKTWGLVFPAHIADAKIGLHFGRARGPMVHSVSFGLCLAVCLLCAWMWRKQLGPVGRLIMLLLIPVFLTGVFFSYTRSVWMGTAFGMVLVLAMTLSGPWRKLVLGTLGTAALLLAVVDPQSVLSFERERSASNTKQSAELRASFAFVSWHMFQDRPLLGVGFGRFFREKKPYLDDRTTDLLLDPIREWAHHNTILSILTELGLVGLGLFAAMFVGWAWLGYKLWSNPEAPSWAQDWGALLLGVMGAWLPQSFFHELSYSSLDNSLLFCVAGITVGLYAKYARPVAISPTAAATQRDVAVSQPAAMAIEPSPVGAA